MRRSLIPACLLLVTACGAAPAVGTNAASCDVPAVIGHRGAPNQWVENTVPSIRSAYRAGANVAEVDTQTTASGPAVLMHDETVDRTTNGHGRVDQLSYTKIRSFRTADDTQVPSLSETLQQPTEYGKQLLLEIKGPETETQVAHIANRAGKTGGDRIVVQSFSDSSLTMARKYEPSLPRMRLSTGLGDGALDRAQRLGLYGYAVEAPALDAATVNRMHNAGLQIYAWTVDSTEEWNRMASLGVDAIITNRVWAAAGWHDNHC